MSLGMEPSFGEYFSPTEEAAFDDGGGTVGSAEQADPVGSTPLEPTARKIIYEAQIDLNVGDLEAAAEELTTLIESSGGYLASSEITGAVGSRRSGSWTARVPSGQFRNIVDQIAGLGEVQRRSTNSQEVTEEYVDVQARLNNKRREEERLLSLLENSTSNLKDTLDVERELSRVREELERMTGRLRLLDDLTTLSTLTITMKERLDFNPPQAPGFGTRVARAWGESLTELREAGENLVLGVVFAAPWFLIGGVVLFVAWRLLRLLFRSFRNRVKSQE